MTARKFATSLIYMHTPIFLRPRCRNDNQHKANERINDLANVAFVLAPGRKAATWRLDVYVREPLMIFYIFAVL